MPTITTSDGVQLHYLDDGDPAGPPVVLVAGGKVEAAVVGDSGHAVNIERPDEFNRLLLRFIG